MTTERWFFCLWRRRRLSRRKLRFDKTAGRKMLLHYRHSRRPWRSDAFCTAKPPEGRGIRMCRVNPFCSAINKRPPSGGFSFGDSGGNLARTVARGTLHRPGLSNIFSNDLNHVSMCFCDLFPTMVFLFRGSMKRDPGYGIKLSTNIRDYPKRHMCFYPNCDIR